MQPGFVAIIADVIGSRQATDRPALQHSLRGAIAKVNTEYAQQIASRFLLTIGDEFQGLLHSPKHLDRILSTMRAALTPHELRFGVGFGRLDTELQPQAIGMDGPCLHRARTALDRAKARGTPIEVEPVQARPSLHIYSLLFGALRARWTTKQRRAVDLAQSGQEGKQIAQRLGVSPSAVSQHLSAAGHDALVEATAYWREELLRAFPAPDVEGER
jgi:hypothetical protein